MNRSIQRQRLLAYCRRRQDAHRLIRRYMRRGAARFAELGGAVLAVGEMSQRAAESVRRLGEVLS